MLCTLMMPLIFCGGRRTSRRLVGETYLATAPQHLTVREIAETIVNVFQRGKVMHIEWPEERRRIEIGHVNLSSERLRAITNWEPRYDLIIRVTADQSRP